MFARTRICKGQLLAVLNTEAETCIFQHNQPNAADIRIDYHPSSDVFVSEICYLPLDTLENRTPPDPSRRKGIAMFVSNCGAKWRTNYLPELMKHVHIKPRSTAWLFALKISLLLTIYQRNLVWFMHLGPSQCIGDLHRSIPGCQEITLSLMPVHLVQKSLLIT